MNQQEFDQIYPKNITPGQHQVLDLWLKGLKTKEIADKVHKEVTTINHCFAEIFTRFNLPENERNRDHLTQLFIYHRPDLISDEYKQKLAETGKFDGLSSVKTIQQKVCEAIKEDGALVRIKGLKGSGKTWLLENVIITEAKKEGYSTVTLDLDSNNFNNSEELLQWLCKRITQELDIQLNLNDYWAAKDIPNSNATNYLQKVLQTETLRDNILLIGLDHVEAIFDNPIISNNFCGLLRGWFEESRRNNRNSHFWKQVRIVVLHSREKYAQLDINSSPLAGVGKYFQLNEFNENQIKALIEKHKLNWSQDDIDHLLQLLGGYFDLINQAFKEAKERNLTAEQLVQQAPTNQGIYANHLRPLLTTLNNKLDLKAAFKTVIESSSPVKISDPLHVFHLESMGLVKLNGDLVSPRCELYRQYFLSRI